MAKMILKFFLVKFYPKLCIGIMWKGQPKKTFCLSKVLFYIKFCAVFAHWLLLDVTISQTRKNIFQILQFKMS